ncbi:hypothetical protein HPB50_015756 [Hyalomma asiaticum]|uniref:Uncharacterized protein n=1 Tax=Hyalomma asiaticum TaxID=266040 RepID=A0ACB7SYI3_HYAAI|nr:hypothetical protein HPB50_015756 [Hyalomma asiaticum]
MPAAERSVLSRSLSRRQSEENLLSKGAPVPFGLTRAKGKPHSVFTRRPSQGCVQRRLEEEEPRRDKALLGSFLSRTERAPIKEPPNEKWMSRRASP